MLCWVVLSWVVLCFVSFFVSCFFVCVLLIAMCSIVVVVLCCFVCDVALRCFGFCVGLCCHGLCSDVLYCVVLRCDVLSFLKHVFCVWRVVFMSGRYVLSFSIVLSCVVFCGVVL